MSQDNRDIGKLLKSIQEGLQRYSVQELNKAIAAILKKGGYEQNSLNITYALQIVCDEYGISRYNLLHTKKGRGDIQDAKIIAYCLLHYNLGLTIRYIAKEIFKCFPNSISSGIKTIKDADSNLKHERELLERYKMLQQKLIDKITQQQIQQKEHENIS
jgi:hypothetical protein